MSSTQHRETARLQALDSYRLLDTPRESDFDEIAEAAAELCDSPIGVVNLIGEGRQFFKAEVGLGVRETPRRPWRRGIASGPSHDQAVFSEGPVWWPARTILVWSDIEGRRVLGWHSNGQVEVIVDATSFINGHTIDAEGNLIHCEHGSRGLSCTTPAGQTTALLRDYNGRRFNSPNDVTCAPDGTLWFTDPAFGLHSPRQGTLDEPELDHRSVFRFDPRTGRTSRMADFEQPNGIGFSPNGRTLYVSDTSQALGGALHEIQAFDVGLDGSLSERRVFMVVEPGVPDGFCVDHRGWIWTSSGAGVQVFSDKAELLGVIPTPQSATNCAFGPGDQRLFITSQQHLYAIDLAQ